MVLIAQTSTNYSNWQDQTEIVTELFDQDDGLPVISLSDLEQGADGHLYIATSAGISRFNGSEFDLISSEQFSSLRSNRFQEIHTTPDSAIWMIDEQGFFSRWKKGKLSSFNTLHKNNIQPDWVLKVSDTGDIWINNGHHLKTYKEGTGFITVVDSLDSKILDFLPLTKTKSLLLTKNKLLSIEEEQLITELSIDTYLPKFDSLTFAESKLKKISKNRVVIYNDQQLIIFSIDSGTYRLIELPEEIISIPLSVLEAERNLLLLQTFHGYFNVNLESEMVSKYEHTEGREIPQVSFQPYWINERLYITKCGVLLGQEIIYECEDTARISGIVNDKEGNLWVAIDGKGLVRIAQSPFKTLDKENGLHSNNTYSIIEDENRNIWLASYQAGIHRINDNRIDFWQGGDSRYLNNFLVRALYEHGNGTLFTATWDGGISTFDGDKWNQFFINDTLLLTEAESFLTDQEGNFWVGSRHGLYRKSADSDSFHYVYITNGNPLLRVQVITESPDNTIWFGTNGNGLFIKEKGEEIKPVSFQQRGPPFSIRDIHISEFQTLWLATENNGLVQAKFDENKDLLDYDIINKDDGLNAVGVHRILEDQFGFFWLSSNRGIFRINKSKLKHYVNDKSSQIWIQRFTEKDGLPNREANGGVQSSGLIASDSTIWIPTQKGVVTFDPAYFLNKNPYQHTKIDIQTVTTQDTAYSMYADSSIYLDKGIRTLTINYSLLHYTNPERIQLQYRIAGINEGWQALATGREINITNIPAGTHTIETKMAGVPDFLHQGTSFTIHIPYHFYEKSWFYVLISVLVLGIFSFIILKISYAAKRREETLNQKVRERTKSLSEQKSETEKALQTIRKQAEELEQLNEAKTNFFINITHELRTPLALIKGPLELLKNASNHRKIEPDKQLELIERNSNQLNKLINRLLDLMRMETDTNEDNQQLINLANLVKNRFSQFQSYKNVANKKFDIRISEEPSYVVGDPNFMEIMVNNLISNAIKYTSSGDAILVSVRNKKNNIILEVKDSGIGIKEDNLDSVFEPFYRSPNVSEREGTGIGLSIVKSYVRRFNGTIDIESKPGQGTTVRLQFPREDTKPLKMYSSEDHTKIDEEEEFRTDRTNGELLSSSKQASGKQNILLIDDNKDVRLFLTQLLQEKYNITASSNGTDALHLLNQNSYDLILSDVMMPDMDGITLAQKIRSKAQFSTIPIILLSAKKTNKSITKGLSAGAQVYLTKPIDNKILITQIDALLDREARLKKENQPTETDQQNKFLQQLDKLILRHLSDENLNIDAIADAMHMSRSTLYRKWNKHSEQTLNDYITEVRLKEAIRIIREKNYTFAEASMVCGFSEPAYFSKVFKKVFNVTPTEYFKTQNNV